MDYIQESEAAIRLYHKKGGKGCADEARDYLLNSIAYSLLAIAKTMDAVTIKNDKCRVVQVDASII